MQPIKSKRVYYKSEARFYLKYNYIRQVFMTALIMFATAGLNSLKDSVVALVDYDRFYTLPLRIFFDLLIFLLVIPLWVGVVYVSGKLAEGERPSAGVMLEFFSSPSEMLNCLRFICSFIMRIAAFFVPFLIFGAMLSRMRAYLDIMIGSNLTADIAMAIVCVVFFLAFFLGLIFMMRYFAVLYIFVKNPYLSTAEIVKKSVRMMRGRRIEAICYILSFALWVIVSSLLAGIPYIFFTLPYMILSYITFFSCSVAEDDKEEFFKSIGDMIDEKARRKETPAESGDTKISSEIQ